MFDTIFSFSYSFSYSCEMLQTFSTPGVLNECDKCQMNITQIYDKKHWHEYCELLQFSSNLLKIYRLLSKFLHFGQL